MGGAAGPGLNRSRDTDNDGEAMFLYDPKVCALLTNSINQSPMERITFERMCNSIVRNKKMQFRLFTVKYDNIHTGRAVDKNSNKVKGQGKSDKPCISTGGQSK